jgi:hypothetical protein
MGENNNTKYNGILCFMLSSRKSKIIPEARASDMFLRSIT